MKGKKEKPQFKFEVNLGHREEEQPPSLMGGEEEEAAIWVREGERVWVYEERNKNGLREGGRRR